MITKFQKFVENIQLDNLFTIKPCSDKDLIKIRNIFKDIVWMGDKPAKFVAYVDGEIAGAIFVRELPEYYTWDVAVLPKYQKRGIAKKLIETWTQWYDSQINTDKYVRVLVAEEKLLNTLYELGYEYLESDDDATIVIYDPKNVSSEYQGFFQ